MIQVIALTNGDRENFAKSVSSFKKNLKSSQRMEWTVYSNGTDPEFRDWVKQNFPWIHEVKQTRYQLREAWDSIHPDTDYLLQIDDKSQPIDELDVDQAISALDDYPYLAQLMFFKGVEEEPDFVGQVWREHEFGWLIGPSVYRAAVAELGWPVGRVPQERFTRKLMKNSSAWRFAEMLSERKLLE